MDIKDLKVGDVVCIREDLELHTAYGDDCFIPGMKTGIQEVTGEANKIKQKVKVANDYYYYTPEMIDWEKTRRLKLNESWENIKKEIRGDGKFKEIIFKEIIQSGESENETTKAVTQNREEIIAENNNEENDVEKVVMLLMLKSLGVTYSEIKKEVEKVKIKWVPQLDEKYYYINTSGKADFLYWKGHSIDTGRLEFNNCFETRKEAEEKIEKIKEILKGE